MTINQNRSAVDASLYQIALFKGVMDVIGKYLDLQTSTLLTVAAEESQGSRPLAYAQEPSYNELDKMLLQSLGIEIVLDPHGWDMVTHASFTFCPFPPLEVCFKTMRNNPALYLAPELDMSQDIMQRRVSFMRLFRRKAKGRRVLRITVWKFSMNSWTSMICASCQILKTRILPCGNYPACGCILSRQSTRIELCPGERTFVLSLPLQPVVTTAFPYLHHRQPDRNHRIRSSLFYYFLECPS